MDRSVALAFFMFVGFACGGEAPAIEATTSSGSDTLVASSSTDAEPEVCYPGYERCPCMDGACLDGLVCLSDLCVAPAVDGTSTSDGETTDDGETTMPVTTMDESESSGAVESSSEDGSESSTGDPEPVCLDGDNYCEDDDFQTCVDGQWEYMNCTEKCAQTGYLHEGCANQDSCNCTGFADDFCANGAYVTCVCAEVIYDIECTDASMNEWFDGCFDESQDFVVCLADFEVASVQDCQVAFDACDV